jgi:hypothetical protein
MMRLFRKIRRKLLDERNLKTYLFYAISEILLVVIGILIAVQVNTIHNNREIIELEKKILLEIDKNLKGDLIEIQDDLEAFIIISEVDAILIEHFQLKRPFDDSIGANIHVFELSPHFSPARSGYNLLESKGIDLISDDSLRIQITDFYERRIPYYFKYAEERFQMVQALIIPYLTNHFYLEEHHKWPYTRRVPMNYESLLKDPGLISLFQTSAFHASVMSRKTRNLKTEIESLQSQINTFLEK